MLTSGLNDLAWALIVLSSFPRLWRAALISNALFAAAKPECLIFQMTSPSIGGPSRSSKVARAMDIVFVAARRSVCDPQLRPLLALTQA